MKLGGNRVSTFIFWMKKRRTRLIAVLMSALLVISCSGEEDSFEARIAALFPFSTVYSEFYWSGAQNEREWVARHIRRPEGAASARSAAAEEDSSARIPSPHMRRDGGKFRVAVVFSGEYWEYFDNFKGLVEGFSNIGWANTIPIPSAISMGETLIAWLARTNYSEYVEFPPEYFFNMEWGDDDSAEEILIRNMDSINGKVDCVIAYGTMAAKMFYDLDAYSVPVVADAVSDPIMAGVTLTERDSGKEFFTIRVDPDIYRKQVRLFHDIVGFKKLGIVYGDDVYGRSYGAVRDVETVANERGFEIIRNTNMTEDITEETVPLYLAALRDVASKADAVYLGAPNALTEFDIVHEVVAILDEAGVPSFSLEGTIRVKDGVLFSLSSSGMIRSGIYTAAKLARLFEGDSARSQNQIFESVPEIAVNLASAASIGFKVPVSLIVESDEIYLSRDGSLPIRRLELTEGEGDYRNYTDLAALGASGVMTMPPRFRPDGNPFRIAIFQSGSYWEFDEHFHALVDGFITNGWAKSDTELLPEQVSIDALIPYLDNFSDYVEFPPEHVYNLEWGANNEAVAAFFAEKKPDVDLILALGSAAGELFNNVNEYPIPVVMEGITDPVGSGFITSSEDSGRNFVTCRIDPQQYRRQIQLFHDFTGFNRLGIVYGDNLYGRSYGAVNDVEYSAQRLNFEIVRNTNVREEMADDTVELYLAALRDVASKADAVYLGASTALTEYDIMDKVSAILEEAQVPSFALEGGIRVRQGAMLGISSLGLEKFGLYNANKITMILSGLSPRNLPQELEGVPSIILNIDTMADIHFPLSLSMISSVDEIVGE